MANLSGWFLGHRNGTFVWAVRTDGDLYNNMNMTVVRSKRFDRFKWYHLAATFQQETLSGADKLLNRTAKGTQMRLYVNGQMYGGKTKPGGGFSAVPRGNLLYDRVYKEKGVFKREAYDEARVLVGSLTGDSAGAMDGIIDDVTIAGRAFRSNEVKDHAHLRPQTKNQTRLLAENEEGAILHYIPFGPGELPGYEAQDIVPSANKVLIERPVGGVVKWVEEPPPTANMADQNLVKIRTLARRLDRQSCRMATVTTPTKGNAPSVNVPSQTVHVECGAGCAGNSSAFDPAKAGTVQMLLSLRQPLFGNSASQIPQVGAIRTATIQFMTTSSQKADPPDAPRFWRLYIAEGGFNAKNVTTRNMPQYNNMTFEERKVETSGEVKIDITRFVRQAARQRNKNFTLVFVSRTPGKKGQTFWSPTAMITKYRPKLTVEIQDTTMRPIQMLGQADRKNFAEAEEVCTDSGRHLCTIAELSYASEVAAFTECSCGWTNLNGNGTLALSISRDNPPKDDCPVPKETTAVYYKPCEGKTQAPAYCCTGEENGGIPPEKLNVPGPDAAA